MPGLQYFGSRNENTWKIIETERYIFHIESSVDMDEGLERMIKGADERYLQICDVLEIDCATTKSKERLRKYNIWIHSHKIAGGNHVTPKEAFMYECTPHSQWASGVANASGVNFVKWNIPWHALEGKLLHEETHAIWSHEVGEAPSLLNEGVAVYVENLLHPAPDALLPQERSRFWHEQMGADDWLLRKLTDNEYFFNDPSKVPAFYNISGLLVGFIIKKWGVALLKDIFLASYYEDENIAELIEGKTKLSMEALQCAVGEDLASTDPSHHTAAAPSL
ncbi:MAG: hypothetical protein FWG38_00455 [Defluviitaleaceae bacterium]|nr:hypothetical protein [Defluviitaleaceae bacterium]